MNQPRRRLGSPAGQDRSDHLERDSVVIDITADQFEDVTEAVIVSATSTWQRTEFRPVSSPRPANMSFFADRTAQTEMNDFYAAVSRRADYLKAT